MDRSYTSASPLCLYRHIMGWPVFLFLFCSTVHVRWYNSCFMKCKFVPSHAVKAYGGSGSIASLILISALGGVFNCMLWLFYCQRKRPQYTLCRRLCGLQSWSGWSKEEKNWFSLSGLASHFLPCLLSQLYSCCVIGVFENITRRLVPIKVYYESLDIKQKINLTL